MPTVDCGSPLAELWAGLEEELLDDEDAEDEDEEEVKDKESLLGSSMTPSRPLASGSPPGGSAGCADDANPFSPQEFCLPVSILALPFSLKS